MAFQTQDQAEEVMSEINMTPLVDVMLVLLIIFMVTAPLMRQAVNIDLPKANSQPLGPKPGMVRLNVSAQGAYDLDGLNVSATELESRLHEMAVREPQPQLLIQGDRMARYEGIAQVLAATHRAGLKKVGFVMEKIKETP
ncbi:MAG: biopolymer transporter ExbD [Alphaproteobacteria bacterium]|nr:biopolymer transporter ExbD [Alphaproteobacteria bacterium]